MTSLFTISIGDIQDVAVQRIGRKLTAEELRRVKKGLQSGLGFWEYMAEVAIDEVTRDTRKS